MGGDMLGIAFVVLVIGGLGSLYGAVAAGIVVGVVQSLMTIAAPAQHHGDHLRRDDRYLALSPAGAVWRALTVRPVFRGIGDADIWRQWNGPGEESRTIC